MKRHIHRPPSKDPAVKLLAKIADSLPLRSVQRDIVVCALLYLEGDTQPGHTVERWWAEQEAA